MTDRYAVIGNPVAHSQSPRIHAEFARQTGQDIAYEKLLAPLDAFEITVRRFFDEGGKGLNVTVPFKNEAFRIISPDTVSFGGVVDAEAVNTIKVEGKQLIGYNTDGIGLVTDLEKNLGFTISGKRVLLMGAGGAAQGVMHPLLQRRPGTLVIANRTPDKAERLAKRFARFAPLSMQGISAVPYSHLGNSPFDLVINATSAGLSGEMPELPQGIFANGALAYDMVYGRDTPFLQFARQSGARAVDGLGMLVEQAAESFFIWRGVRPQTAPVIALLRDS